MSDDLTERWILAGGPQSFEEFEVAEVMRTAPDSIEVPWTVNLPAPRHIAADDLPDEVEFAYTKYVRTSETRYAR